MFDFVHRLRRWCNIKTALVQCAVFAGIVMLENVQFTSIIIQISI